MKKKFLIPGICLSLSLFVSTGVLKAEYQYSKSKYARDRDYRDGRTIPSSYSEDVHSVYDDPSKVQSSKVKIIGYETSAPESRFLENIKEGVTDQITLLKLLSAPNVITRSPEDKETWIYHWIWSYSNEYNPNQTEILMDKAGKRVRRNKKPVSLVITFNTKDIVESYTLKYLKVKKDRFSEF